MATITPNFDFEVNDTPTRALLREQALSLQVTDINLGDLDASIVPISAGDESGATGSLVQGSSAVGSLWIDPLGNIWVMEQSGPVRIYSYEGGYETRRYWVTPGEGYLPGPMFPGFGVGAAVGGPREDFGRSFDATTVTNIAAQWKGADESFDDNDSGRLNGMVQETVSSGNRRVSLRGLCIIRDNPGGGSADVLASSLRRNHRVFRNTNTTTYFKQSFYNTVLDDTRWQGYACFPGPEASVVSAGSGNHTFKVQFWAYNFGVFHRTTEEFQD